MKYGLDRHGVIDTYPKFFSEFSSRAVANGHEVHIITGSMYSEKVENQLLDLRISWTHFFSVADSLIGEGIKVTFEDSDNPWFDEIKWDHFFVRCCSVVDGKTSIEFIGC